MLLTLGCLLAVGLAVTAPSPTTRVWVVVGPSNHPPETHEVRAGGRLVADMLSRSPNVTNVSVEIIETWPDDFATFDEAHCLVFLGDLFPPTRMPNSERIMADLGRLTQRGVGIVCLHYATGVHGNDVGPNGDHPLLRWVGGYFAEPGSPHHSSIARIFEAARIEPAAPEHPISRGWSAFTLHDEPYIQNYFGPKDNQPAPNVTILATSMLPPESPRSEAVAWCIERPDGGRGFAIVMPHFYRNWTHPDLRRFILNGIVWAAGREVPVQGVQSPEPDLDQYRDAHRSF